MLTCLIDCTLPGPHDRLVARSRGEDISAEAEVVRVDGVAGEPKLVEDAVSEGRRISEMIFMRHRDEIRFVKNRKLHPELELMEEETVDYLDLFLVLYQVLQIQSLRVCHEAKTSCVIGITINSSLHREEERVHNLDSSIQD